MKKLIITPLLFLLVLSFKGQGQENSDAERFGRTLNVGVGIGYYGYVGHSIPVATMNYEFDVARNFTLAPFIGFYTYSNSYYWGDNIYLYRGYSYRETVIPVGVKGTYYFDELLRANPKWDFYASADLGFAFTSVTWERGYSGNRTLSNGANRLYLDGHIGSEYHMTERVGLYLDLSSGFSSIGLAFHL